MRRENIKNLTPDELARAMADAGEPRHRARQIMKWLYRKAAGGFDEMTDLPLSLRAALAERWETAAVETIESVRSETDGSQKFLLALRDGECIEAVLMDTCDHKTICISSQVGCPLGCRFCRTGDGGFVRDLDAAEIVDQILFFVRRHMPPRRRFNIVFMGMGDPLLNLGHLARAIGIINHPDGLALREKRLTVSTIGFPGPIRELAGSDLRFGLAVSLNATTDEARHRLMPGARDMIETLDAAEFFARARGERVTLEYVLLAGVNDSDADAGRLVELTAGRPFKINLIPFNEWEGCPFRRPDDDAVDRFAGLLLPRAPAVTVRRSRGGDIGAACGQLRARVAEDRGEAADASDE